jgi:cell division protein FtsI/penicillin-binding protein 2
VPRGTAKKAFPWMRRTPWQAKQARRKSSALPRMKNTMPPNWPNASVTTDLFIAFAPVENPQIAIAVIVENGNSGSGAAAPVARNVLDAWLLGQNASRCYRACCCPN